MSLLLAALLAAAAAQVDQGPAEHRGEPANGVDEPPRRGTFVETSFGVFTALGGSAGSSNPQYFLGLTLGREIAERAAVFASLGVGATSASCYLPATNGSCLAADSFAVTFLEAGASYGFPVLLRTLLSLKLVAGYTDLSPGPVVTSNGNVPDHVPGFHFGGGVSADYDTHLDHFAIGMDLLLRYTMARYSMTMPSVTFTPRIRYVF
ncbi:MAG TPA: adventurous gliding motility protein CglE [Myxococcales bacterium]|nr:adventurous gliding motility protein CglE [Myxococcales bacterium]